MFEVISCSCFSSSLEISSLFIVFLPLELYRTLGIIRRGGESVNLKGQEELQTGRCRKVNFAYFYTSWIVDETIPVLSVVLALAALFHSPLTPDLLVNPHGIIIKGSPLLAGESCESEEGVGELKPQPVPV